MHIIIDISRSAQENANGYFEKSKKARKKIAGAVESIKELEKKLRERKETVKKETERSRIREITEKEWYERFRWFFASDGSLAIGGRDARQNEILVGRHFEDSDLFFHADVFGASVVILKGGAGKDRKIKEEAAQFAACHSRAWEQSASATVYSLARNSVSKSTQKGSLGTGSFLLSGEREWFKDVRLELCAFIKEGVGAGTKKLNIAPKTTCERLGISSVLITPGNVKKSDAAKFISKILEYKNIDEIMQALPAGTFTVKKG